MIIEVDEYKKKVSNYDANKSEDFHRESAKLADRDFIAHLKTKKYKRIIFMAGGTASGKTEYSVSYLKYKDQLTYDGTLKNFDGFKIKLSHIKKHSDKSKIKVVLIIPRDLSLSYNVFHARERKMSDVVFFETQIKSKEAVAKILRETKIRVEIYLSIYDDKKEKLSFKRVTALKSRNDTANLLNDFALEIRKLAKDNHFTIK